MNRKLLLFILIIGAIGLSIYVYLGGFNTPSVVITTSETRHIAGKPFEGLVNEEAFGQRFRDAAEALESKKLAGTLANIYYNNPEEKDDSIKAFIGVLIPDSSATLPPGYELRTLPGGKKVVQATVKAHYLLAPNRLYEALFKYVEKNNLKVKEQYLEQFAEDGQGMVQVEIIP